MVSKSCHH